MFIKRINKRIKIIFLISLIPLLLIILKVLYIQVFDYNKLKESANDLWSRNLNIEADIFFGNILSFWRKRCQ